MKIIKVTLIPLALIFSLETYSQTEGNVPDSLEVATLKDIYFSLTGDNWIDNTNWPDSVSWSDTIKSSEFGTWYGITVANNDITEIALYQNNLYGPIPESIGNLTELQKLNLYGNIITGYLPSSLNKCTKLDRIELYKNLIEGDLRPLCFLPNLLYLDVSTNILTDSIPPELFENSTLAYIAIEGNQLVGPIPETIGMATNLRNFGATNNQLSGSIPESINNCIELRNLSLTGNNLTGQLPSLSNLIYLKNLNLINNQLQGNPFISLQNCTILEVLHLYGNDFEGVVPNDIDKFSNLKILILSFNEKITGEFPSTIGNLQYLQDLQFGGCNLSGNLPDVFGNLSNLKSLDLSRNSFEGNLPQSICSLPLTHLDLGDGNKFLGEFPSCYASMSNLNFFRISGNVTGEVPQEFNSFPNLQYLYLGSTNITSIPNFKLHPNASNLLINIAGTKVNLASVEYNLDNPDSTSNSHSFKNFYYSSLSYGGLNYYEFNSGDSLRIEATAGGNYATYKWQKYDSITSTYNDVTALNESGDPQFFIINSPVTSDFGTYRVITNNSWISEELVSGPLVAVPYSNDRTLYAARSGGWNEEYLWALYAGGTAFKTIPRSGDKVIINGYSVTIGNTGICKDLILEQSANNTTLLKIKNGKLNVLNTLDIIDDPVSELKCEIELTEIGEIAVGSN